MSNYAFWNVAGSYYEVCNCEAICPCRRHGERAEGRSTYGVCDFALSWFISEGRADGIALANLSVVLAGSYSDDEAGSPWRVVLYVDEKANEQQQQALSDIFLGRSGGGTYKQFACAIDEVYGIRRATIELDHSPNQEKMDVKGYLSTKTAQPYLTVAPVSCGIPGHDRPGQEIVAEHFLVADGELSWEVNGRCGFATDFAYSSTG